MFEFSGRGILLDIEGTTTSISFVYDVMFPLVRRELSGFVQSQWGQQDVIVALDRLAVDQGYGALGDWLKKCGDLNGLCEDVNRLMDDDVKATGLKTLQGLIWDEAFRCGELKAHLYDDVPPALAAWKSAGVDVRIYSSGSIHAQKLFFGHTEKGDLLHYFRGFYDTTTGPKKESASYSKIAGDFGLPAGEILFLSDVPAELDAARSAGMQTALAKRPGNAVVNAGHGHAEISSFADIHVTKAN
jgi:enolase-phosphatase E1